MLPPRLVRRLVLAPLAVVIALAVVLLSPVLALLILGFELLRRVPPSRRRGLRLLRFALIWLTAETAALLACLGLWVASGFGGRLSTEPYQSRHYAIMRRFLDRLYRAATRAFRLRVEIDEPELTAEEQAARLARPVIVLSRHAGPGDSLLLVRHLLTVYGRRPRVVMKASMQFDPGVDVVANRVPNVFIRPRQVGEQIFTEQIQRLAQGLDPGGRTGDLPGGRQLDAGPVAARASGGWSGWTGTTWPPGRSQMPNVLPPRPAARSRPSRPAPRPT